MTHEQAQTLYEQALAILNALGVSTPVALYLQECVDRVINQILVYCNIDEIPERLMPDAAKAVVAEYFSSMAEVVSIKDGRPVTHVAQGDTSVTYGDASGFITDYIKRNTLNHNLLNAYRKLRW